MQASITRPSGFRSLGDWLIIGALVHRTLVNPIIILGSAGALGRQVPVHLAVVILLTGINAVLTLWALSGRSVTLLRSRAFMAGDLLLTLTVNLGSAALLPPNRILLPYCDIFWLYATSTAALWTVVRGARTGAVLLGVGAMLPAAMTIVNRAALTQDGFIHLIARDGWLVAAIAIPVLVERLSNGATRRAVDESNRKGRALERARVFRDLHDTVLQAFAQIGWRATARAAGWRAEIRDTAAQQLEQLKAAMTSDDRRRDGLRDNLHALAREFAGRGLNVPLAISELTVEPPDPVVRALIGATREALTNVCKHSGAHEAQLQVTDTGEAIQIKVHDQGSGFTMDRAASGFGIPQSIQGRLTEAGGRAEITSAPGAGTTVTLHAPTGLYNSNGPNVTPNESQTVDLLAGTAIGWFALVALAYRVALSPLQAVTALANLNLHITIVYAVIVAVVLCGDVLLFGSALFGRFPGLLKSPVLLVADAAVCGAMNLWAAHVLPVGTQLHPGYDILWTYVVGVVVFWTVLRGAGTGLALVTAALVLQFPMAWVNGADLTRTAVMQIGSRQGWLLAAFLLAWMVSTLARSSARRAVTAGLDAGRSIEQAWALRDTYTDVSESLARIADCCEADDLPPEQVAMTVRGLAMSAASRLRTTLQPPVRPEQELAARLGGIAEEYRARGLRVEFVGTELTEDPPTMVGATLQAAVQDALECVARKEGAIHVVVRAASTEDGVEIAIRARRRGADRPSPLSPVRLHAMRVALGQAGARLDDLSSPSGGMRLRLTWVQQRSKETRED